MKIPCCIVQDLLPIYIEKMTSAQTGELIEAHLADCEQCSAALAKLNSAEQTVLPALKISTSLERVRNDMKKRKMRSSILASLIVFLAAFAVFSYLTKPIYVSYKESGVEVTETVAHEVYVSFSERVTSCKVSTLHVDGQVIREVEAWTSVWDRILGNTTPSVSLSSEGEQTDTVYYCDYSKEQDNMTVIYGSDPNANGGVVALPRLFLGYYFTMAAAGTVLIGLAWFILRKKKTASAVCRYLFFIPTSYLLGNVLLSTSFASFSAARDFVMALIASTAIYGICIVGWDLIKQHIADRAL